MNSESLSVSIVFPAYNRQSEVVETLEKLEQILSLPYEVIILDNSPERHDHEFAENVKYIFTGKNLGAAARNIGITEAKAPFILMLDDDSHPEKGSVEAALKKLADSPKNIAGITGPVFRPDGGRDILRRCAAGDDLDQVKIEGVMSRDLFIVKEDEDVEYAMMNMDRLHIRHAPVMNAESKIIDLISIRDILRSRIEECKITIEHLSDFSRGTRKNEVY